MLTVADAERETKELDAKNSSGEVVDEEYAAESYKIYRKYTRGEDPVASDAVSCWYELGEEINAKEHIKNFLAKEW
jgi:hypothetical protein